MSTIKSIIRGPAIDEQLDPHGRELYRFWLSAAASGVPHRQNFDPTKYHQAWPGIQIVEHAGPPAEFRYRLVGTREVDLRGHDPTGKPVSEGFFGASAEIVLENYRLVIADRQPLCALGRYRKKSGLEVTDVSLFLPLRSGHSPEPTLILVYSYQRRE